MTAFEAHLPTRIVFGRGRLAELGPLTRDWGTRALLVCGRSAMRRTGVLERAVSLLTSAGVAVTAFDRVSPSPRSDEVDEAVRLARRDRCDVIIGLGGGSAIDAAKATAVGVAHPGVGALVGRTLSPDGDALPIVAVPTTAGSGSEVTKGAIITDVTRGLRSGIRGDDLFPRVALIDPDLSATAPPAVALHSGFDALAHLIEGYLGRRASPLTDVLATQAIPALAEHLREIARGGASPRAHEAMCLGAVYGGISVALASTCLPHRLQQALGGLPRVGVSHGQGLAILYPAWLRRAAAATPGRAAVLAEMLGGTDLPSEVSGLLAGTGLTLTLSQVGYTQAELRACAASVTGNIENDPIDGAGAEVIESIYEEAF